MWCGASVAPLTQLQEDLGSIVTQTQGGILGLPISHFILNSFMSSHVERKPNVFCTSMFPIKQICLYDHYQNVFIHDRKLYICFNYSLLNFQVCEKTSFILFIIYFCYFLSFCLFLSLFLYQSLSFISLIAEDCNEE